MDYSLLCSTISRNQPPSSLAVSLPLKTFHCHRLKGRKLLAINRTFPLTDWPYIFPGLIFYIIFKNSLSQPLKPEAFQRTTAVHILLFSGKCDWVSGNSFHVVFSFRQGHSSALKLCDSPALVPQSVQWKDSFCHSFCLITLNDTVPETIKQTIKHLCEVCIHLLDWWQECLFSLYTLTFLSRFFHVCAYVF